MKISISANFFVNQEAMNIVRNVMQAFWNGTTACGIQCIRSCLSTVQKHFHSLQTSVLDLAKDFIEWEHKLGEVGSI